MGRPKKTAPSQPLFEMTLERAREIENRVPLKARISEETYYREVKGRKYGPYTRRRYRFIKDGREHFEQWTPEIELAHAVVREHAQRTVDALPSEVLRAVEKVMGPGPARARDTVDVPIVNLGGRRPK